MKGQPVEVLDLLTNKTMLFTSQTDAANFFLCSHQSYFSKKR